MPPRPPRPAHLTKGERLTLGRLLAAAVTGHVEVVRAEAATAFAQGLAPMRVREALLMVVPYAGYPRALAALACAGLPPLTPATTPDEAPPAAFAARGREAFDAVYGATAPRVLAGLAALDPRLPAWTLEHAYGRVLARPGLELRDRELLAVSILTALGGLADPLLGHMRGALRLGATPEDIAAMVEALPGALADARRAEARGLLGRLGG